MPSDTGVHDHGANGTKDLTTKLPASELTTFHPETAKGAASRKTQHAVTQLFAKNFLAYFFPKSEKVAEHAREALHLESAADGGTLGVIGGIAARNAELRSNPLQQAASLGGTGISVADANAPPAMAPSIGHPMMVPADPMSYALSRIEDPAVASAMAEQMLRDSLKRQRIEFVPFVREQLQKMDALDSAMEDHLRRESRNNATLMLTGPGAAVAGTSDGTMVASSGDTLPDNGFMWTVVGRLSHLIAHSKVPSTSLRLDKKEEATFGMKMSKAFKEHYGQTPKELNGAKAPQEDSAGVPRPTNQYTEQQCRAVVDQAIVSFMAARATAASSP